VREVGQRRSNTALMPLLRLCRARRIADHGAPVRAPSPPWKRIAGKNSFQLGLKLPNELRIDSPMSGRLSVRNFHGRCFVFGAELREAGVVEAVAADEVDDQQQEKRAEDHNGGGGLQADLQIARRSWGRGTTT